MSVSLLMIDETLYERSGRVRYAFHKTNFPSIHGGEQKVNVKGNLKVQTLCIIKEYKK